MKMATVLGNFTAAAAVSLAVFMAVMGYVALWLAPVMLVWNISPLIAARAISARAGLPFLPVVMLLFAIGYVTLAIGSFYEVFFLEQSTMAGFTYLFVPFLGWFGLACSCFAALAIAWLRQAFGS